MNHISKEINKYSIIGPWLYVLVNWLLWKNVNRIKGPAMEIDLSTQEEGVTRLTIELKYDLAIFELDGKNNEINERAFELTGVLEKILQH